MNFDQLMQKGWSDEPILFDEYMRLGQEKYGMFAGHIEECAGFVTTTGVTVFYGGSLPHAPKLKRTVATIQPQAKYTLPPIPAGVVVTPEWVSENCKIIRSKREDYAFAIASTGQQITTWSRQYMIACRRLFKLMKLSAEHRPK